MKESPPDPPKSVEASPAGPVVPKMGPDGCPVFPEGRGGTVVMRLPDRTRVCAIKTTIATLVNMLMTNVDRPMFDKTGLTRQYDFKLEFQPDGPAGPPGGGIASAAQGGAPDAAAPVGGAAQESAPPIAAAFQNQLGLKLEAKKSPADMLIIDHVEKTPTEN
jgi:uncharacterized protein (TIGR03435 family)